MAINKRNSTKGVRQEVNLTKFDTANQQDKLDNEGKETKHKPIDGQDDYTRPAFASHPTLSHLHASDAMLKEQIDLQLHKDDQQEMDVQDPHHPSYWEPYDLQQEGQDVCNNLDQVQGIIPRSFSVLPNSRIYEEEEMTHQDQMSKVSLTAAHFLG